MCPPVSTIHHALLENIISEGVLNILSKKMPNYFQKEIK